ncbi:MAG: hypothetical protein EA411_01545 [Saprospirales bacterium]|nr:MAG: hypothetical protein EA411_01545 [Saprospirales bacterium]
MSEKYTSIHYHNYLQLEKILSAQDMRSALDGKPAHDEMLFIIIHQVYELWFKEIAHDLGSVIEMFKTDNVDERSISVAVARLDRIIEIQKVLIAQIRVLETMTSLDFLDFRNYLFPASGFQSHQFRMVELMLGLKSEQRITYNDAPYTDAFQGEQRKILEELEQSDSMLDLLEAWLERTPFLEFKNFNFLEAYREAVKNMLQEETSAIEESDILSEEEKKQRLAMLGDTDSYFASVLDEKQHEKLIEKGELKLSYKATMAALLINLYRDEPILQMPHLFITKILEIDDLLTSWRFRHAQMVMRMLGRKTGTGGSSGHKYLRKTADQHKIFSDLHNISTLLIPRSKLPKLPAELKKQLGFNFTADD